MKVGDGVRFRDVEGRTGVLVDYGTFSDGWWDILDSEGSLVVWPESQLELLEQNELTNQQLEEVRGGMSAERFDRWRVERINEV
jgi:hypothetical protein